MNPVFLQAAHLGFGDEQVEADAVDVIAAGIGQQRMVFGNRLTRWTEQII
jgi:hypothetical protein